MQDTLDTFPDDPKSRPSMLELVASVDIKLTPIQRIFKQLVANIEALELRLKQVAALVEAFRPHFHQKLRPLLDERDMLNREMVLFLDAQLLHKRWTSNQRKTMKDIVCALAEQLLATAFAAEMNVILDRHSDITADDSAATSSSTIQVGTDDLLGPNGEPCLSDEILREALRQLDEREQAKAQHAEARAARKRGGKKSAKQVKAEQHALDAGKLLKEIYRKLTSVLHPDREPDEAERLRKTALMSEANKAYENKNLLKLLQLQLKTSKIDSLSAFALADEKLQLINHSLREQFSALQTECQQLDMFVREEFNLEYHGVLTATVLQKALSAATAAEKANNRVMRLDLSDVRRDDASLKSWLKEQRQMMKDDERIGAAFEMAVMGVPRRR